MRSPREVLGRLLAERGVPLWGVCAFANALPLLDCRAKGRVPHGARSVVVCAFPYHTGEFPGRNVCRYAVADDYHALAGGILQEVCERLQQEHPAKAFAHFVDNSPLPEVRVAARCGLGRVGGHGLLITREWGSWVVLGAIVTTLEVDIDQPVQNAACPGCGACRRACPTGALREDGSKDRARCRSAITQKKGLLSDWEAAQLRAGGLAWGCDLCQEACPLNRDAATTPLAAFRERLEPRLTRENLPLLLAHKAYGYRGRAVLERNLELLDESASPPADSGKET